jgi:hypothetical protein
MTGISLFRNRKPAAAAAGEGAGAGEGAENTRENNGGATPNISDATSKNESYGGHNDADADADAGSDVTNGVTSEPTVMVHHTDFTSFGGHHFGGGDDSRPGTAGSRPSTAGSESHFDMSNMGMSMMFGNNDNEDDEGSTMANTEHITSMNMDADADMDVKMDTGVEEIDVMGGMDVGQDSSGTTFAKGHYDEEDDDSKRNAENHDTTGGNGDKAEADGANDDSAEARSATTGHIANTTEGNHVSQRSDATGANDQQNKAFSSFSLGSMLKQRRAEKEQPTQEEDREQDVEQTDASFLQPSVSGEHGSAHASSANTAPSSAGPRNIGPAVLFNSECQAHVATDDHQGLHIQAPTKLNETPVPTEGATGVYESPHYDTAAPIGEADYVSDGTPLSKEPSSPANMNGVSDMDMEQSPGPAEAKRTISIERGNNSESSGHARATSTNMVGNDDCGTEIKRPAGLIGDSMLVDAGEKRTISTDVTQTYKPVTMHKRYHTTDGDNDDQTGTTGSFATPEKTLPSEQSSSSIHAETVANDTVEEAQTLPSHNAVANQSESVNTNAHTNTKQHVSANSATARSTLTEAPVRKPMAMVFNLNRNTTTEEGRGMAYIAAADPERVNANANQHVSANSATARSTLTEAPVRKPMAMVSNLNRNKIAEEGRGMGYIAAAGPERVNANTKQHVSAKPATARSTLTEAPARKPTAMVLNLNRNKNAEEGRGVAYIAAADPERVNTNTKQHVSEKSATARSTLTEAPVRKPMAMVSNLNRNKITEEGRGMGYIAAADPERVNANTKQHVSANAATAGSTLAEAPVRKPMVLNLNRNKIAEEGRGMAYIATADPERVNANTNQHVSAHSATARSTLTEAPARKPMAMVLNLNRNKNAEEGRGMAYIAAADPERVNTNIKQHVSAKSATARSTLTEAPARKPMATVLNLNNRNSMIHLATKPQATSRSGGPNNKASSSRVSFQTPIASAAVWDPENNAVVPAPAPAPAPNDDVISAPSSFRGKLNFEQQSEGQRSTANTQHSQAISTPRNNVATSCPIATHEEENKERGLKRPIVSGCTTTAMHRPRGVPVHRDSGVTGGNNNLTMSHSTRTSHPSSMLPSKQTPSNVAITGSQRTVPMPHQYHHQRPSIGRQATGNNQTNTQGNGIARISHPQNITTPPQQRFSLGRPSNARKPLMFSSSNGDRKRQQAPKVTPAKVSNSMGQNQSHNSIKAFSKGVVENNESPFTRTGSASSESALQRTPPTGDLERIQRANANSNAPVTKFTSITPPPALKAGGDGTVQRSDEGDDDQHEKRMHTRKASMNGRAHAGDGGRARDAPRFSPQQSPTISDIQDTFEAKMGVQMGNRVGGDVPVQAQLYLKYSNEQEPNITNSNAMSPMVNPESSSSRASLEVYGVPGTSDDRMHVQTQETNCVSGIYENDDAPGHQDDNDNNHQTKIDEQPLSQSEHEEQEQVNEFDKYLADFFTDKQQLQDIAKRSEDDILNMEVDLVEVHSEALGIHSQMMKLLDSIVAAQEKIDCDIAAAEALVA